MFHLISSEALLTFTVNLTFNSPLANNLTPASSFLTKPDDFNVSIVTSLPSSNQRKIVKALGLGKVNSTVVLPDNAATRGALLKIAHLISVEEVNK